MIAKPNHQRETLKALTMSAYDLQKLRIQTGNRIRETTTLQPNGLIIDAFAGGGGASLGIFRALGRHPDIAINHDAVAIAMHRTNHPSTFHYMQDVWSVLPRQATKGNPVDLLWASPDCTHFSRAKGGPPIRDVKRRDLAWVVIRWAEDVRPRVIILENVEEFRTWGPLDADNKIIASQSGATFRAWSKRLRRLGYSVEFQCLRACDYGAPTSRRRLFMIARCDGPIVWPAPTHGAPDSYEVRSGGLLPWRAAYEIIDWTIPCPSIFGRKRPLAENTLRRIALGIKKYVLDSPDPFLTGKTKHGLVASHIIKLKGTSRHGQGLRDPLHTVQAGGLHYGEVRAFLVKCGTSIGQDCSSPAHTLLTSKDRLGVVTINFEGEAWVLADIGMRMLSPRELYRAQGFGDDYIIDIDSQGHRITKTDQVRLCGNSVSPHNAAALVKANLVDLAANSRGMPRQRSMF